MGRKVIAAPHSEVRGDVWMAQAQAYKKRPTFGTKIVQRRWVKRRRNSPYMMLDMLM
jgi:hypothetical protein